MSALSYSLKSGAREKNRLLEICCASLECVMAADAGGGDRIELCESLELGGITPSGKLFQEARRSTALPIFVLVRCRAGDFRFRPREVSLMVEQIEQMHDLGADGIVSGALNEEGGIDEEVTSRFIQAAGHLPFTFHRAFDALNDFHDGINRLRDLGVDRILSSAGLSRASDGPDCLRELAEYAGQKPLLLACGGIRSGNVGALARVSDIREFHSAARVAGSGVDKEEVRAIRRAIMD